MKEQTQTSKECTMCKRDTPLDKFSWKNKKLNYLASECKLCENDRKTGWRRVRRDDNRARILHYLGGEYKCTKCGFIHSTSSPFDWHHTSEELKIKSPMLMIHDNWKKLKSELDKCIFLCANCHRIEHHG